MFKRILVVVIVALAGHSLYADTENIDTLQNVVVTGTRNAVDLRLLPSTVTSIDRRTLTGQYQQNVLPMVTQQTPGLFCTSRGVIGYGVSTGAAGAIKVRGIGGGADFLVLIDGQPQYAGLMGHPIADAYQTMLAERVEIVRGPASLLYGSNAMGGVMNIVTRHPLHDGQHTNIGIAAGSYGSLQGEIFNQVRKGKFDSSVGINYQRTNGHRPNSEFEQMNGFLKLGYALSANWKTNADVEITHFNASNPGPKSAPMIDNDQHITRGLASFSLSNQYGKTNGSLRGYYDWGYHKINDGHVAGAAEKTYLYKHNDFIGGISWYQSARLFDGNRTTVGLDWQHFGGRAWNDYFEEGKPHSWLTNTSSGKHLLTQDEVGVYVDFRQELCRWLTLDAGVRYDWHSQSGSEWIPQGGLSAHVCKNGDIKAIVSRGFRNPTLREMYMFKNKNADLNPESLMNYELGYTHRLNDGKGHFGANVFYIKGKNLINSVYDAVLMSQKFKNTGKFSNCGFEFEGSYRFDAHWKVNGNYSFLHMNKAIEGAPEHKLYVSGNYSIKGFTLNVGIQEIANLYLTTGSNPIKETYTLVNAIASYQVAKQVRLWIRGDNLLAQRYQTYQGFYMPKATVMAGVNVDL